MADAEDDNGRFIARLTDHEYAKGAAVSWRRNALRLQQEKATIRAALGSAACPRPANKAPDDLTVSQCVSRLECGCVLGAALSSGLREEASRCPSNEREGR